MVATQRQFADSARGLARLGVILELEVVARKPCDCPEAVVGVAQCSLELLKFVYEERPSSDMNGLHSFPHFL